MWPVLNRKRGLKSSEHTLSPKHRCALAWLLVSWRSLPSLIEVGTLFVSSRVRVAFSTVRARGLFSVDFQYSTKLLGCDDRSFVRVFRSDLNSIIGGAQIVSCLCRVGSGARSFL